VGASEQRRFDLVDARAARAGAGRMDLLLVSLGTAETYGIEVALVREVREPARLTVAPGMPRAMAGVMPLRGAVVAVLSLAGCLGVGAAPAGGRLVVVEHGGAEHALLVAAVDRVVEVDAGRLHAPPAMLAAAGCAVAALAELPDARLVPVLDIERVLAGLSGAAAAS
jgi:two-component system chemotaxis response regulator CheV